MRKVAFIGKMMSGKTTAANHLIRTDHVRRISFADPVKEAAAEMLNTLAEFIDVEAEFDLVSINKEKTKPQVRKLLQLVGTELGREYLGYENVWVDRLKETVRATEKLPEKQRPNGFVVDDCRFPNEAEALRDMGFTIVRITRPEKDRLEMIKGAYPTTYDAILNHPSETSLDKFVPDVLLSARTVENLYERLDEVLNNI